ncbi:MAG TPA: phage holin family protein [Chthoniobacterales bacterium]
MNVPENIQPRRGMSGEAKIGLGITIGAFGVMFLFLGFAQYERQAHESMTVLLAVGAIMFVVGAILALAGSKRRA